MVVRVCGNGGAARHVCKGHFLYGSLGGEDGTKSLTGPTNWLSSLYVSGHEDTLIKLRARRKGKRSKEQDQGAGVGAQLR